MGEHGTLDFKTPELDSEEGGEQNMPLRHRCDACRIIGTVAKPKILKILKNLFRIQLNFIKFKHFYFPFQFGYLNKRNKNDGGF